jgi:hypothetical protein
MESLSWASNNLDSMNSIQQASKEEETRGHPHDPMEVEELEPPSLWRSRELRIIF